MFKNKWIVVTTFVFFSLLHMGYSQPDSFKLMDNTNQFTEEMKGFTEETETILSDFRQVKKLDILTKDIITSGRFYYKKANKLRWEYSDPFEYIIIFNDNEILIRDENRESRYDTESNQMFRQISQLMSRVIVGDILEQEGDFIQAFYENDQQYLVILTPKSEQFRQFFQQIEIYFGRTDLLVKKLAFKEQSEDQTVIEFYNEIRNETIQDSVFFTR